MRKRLVTDDSLREEVARLEMRERALLEMLQQRDIQIAQIHSQARHGVPDGSPNVDELRSVIALHGLGGISDHTMRGLLQGWLRRDLDAAYTERCRQDVERILFARDEEFPELKRIVEEARVAVVAALAKPKPPGVDSVEEVVTMVVKIALLRTRTRMEAS